MSLAAAERRKLELDEVQSELGTLHSSMNCVASEIALDLGAYEAKFNTEKETVEAHKQQLEILMRCNALNDLFNVWFDGEFVTVNGMRIGKLGNQVRFAFSPFLILLVGLERAERRAGRSGARSGRHGLAVPHTLPKRRHSSLGELQRGDRPRFAHVVQAVEVWRRSGHSKVFQPEIGESEAVQPGAAAFLAGRCLLDEALHGAV